MSFLFNNRRKKNKRDFFQRREDKWIRYEKLFAGKIHYDRKKLPLYVGILFFVIIMLAIMSSFMNHHNKTLTTGKFLDSTLKDAPTESSMKAPSELNNFYYCPTAPYGVFFPGEVVNSDSTSIISSYRGMFFVLCETDNPISDDGIYFGINTYASYDSADFSDTVYTEYKSGTGYIGEFEAEYSAGIVHFDGLMSNGDTYCTCYCLKYDSDSYLYFMGFSDEEDNLVTIKNVIDSMCLTIKDKPDEDDTESTEDVSDEDSTESSEQSTATKSSDSTEKETKKYELSLTEDLTEQYIVFTYSNTSTSEITFSLTNPDGEEISQESKYTEDGRVVFYVKDAKAGSYLLTITADEGQVTGATFGAYDLELFQNKYLK